MKLEVWQVQVSLCMKVNQSLTAALLPPLLLLSTDNEAKQHGGGPAPRQDTDRRDTQRSHSDQHSGTTFLRDSSWSIRATVGEEHLTFKLFHITSGERSHVNIIDIYLFLYLFIYSLSLSLYLSIYIYDCSFYVLLSFSPH